MSLAFDLISDARRRAQLRRRRIQQFNYTVTVGVLFIVGVAILSVIGTAIYCIFFQ